MSRRTIARGVAWSLPAITMAATAPMAAASPGVPPTFSFIDACKSPGNSCKEFPKGYDFRFTVCNPNPVPIYLYSVAYSVAGTNLTLVHSLPPLPALLAPAQCITMVFRADGSNSANQDFSAVMTVTWGHTLLPASDPHVHTPVPVPFDVEGTPPDCPCTATPQLSKK